MTSLDFDVPEPPPKRERRVETFRREPDATRVRTRAIPAEVRDSAPPPSVEEYEAQRRTEEESRVPRHVNGSKAATTRELPHDDSAEEHVVAACMLPESGTETIGRCHEAHIVPTWIYNTKARIVLEAIFDLQSRRQPTTIDVVASELRTRGSLQDVGGYAYLTQISDSAPTSAEAAHFVAKVRDLALRRAYIRAHTAAVEGAYDTSGNIDEYIGGSKTSIDTITAGANGIGPGVRLIDCQYPQKGDPQILLGEDDCLSRGGGWLIISYAGVGKSSWAMQMALNFGLGRPMFGLKSHQPRTSLIIQGEDSPRYIGKVSSSFAEAEKLTPEEAAVLRERVIVHEVRGVDGDQFLNTVERLVDKYNPDLVIINPAYIYVAGDINGMKDVKPWLSKLDGINSKRETKVGWIIVHHTSKPAPKDNKGKRAELENWETVYMGTGSSAWANWPRLTAMLEPRASNPDGTHFWLKFGKGWKNTGIVREYTDDKGTRMRPANKIAIQYTEKTMEVAGEQRPMVHWEYDEEGQREADEKAATSRENGKKGGRTAKFEWAFFRGVFTTLAPSEEKAQGYNVLYRLANDQVALSKSSFNIIIAKGVEAGELKRNEGSGKYWVEPGPIIVPDGARDGSDEEPALWYADKD